METHHRDLIQKNYPILVHNCNINLLLPVLVEKEVFSSVMIRKYMTGDDLDRKRELFLDIPMRGPNAFARLVESLRETNQAELADVLQPRNNNVKPIKHATPFLLSTNEEIPPLNPRQILQIGQDHRGNVNLGKEPLQIEVVPATKFYDDPRDNDGPVYSTHSKNRGVVLIINNIKYLNNVHTERRGAEVDTRNLEALFYQMGLKVESYVDLTAAEMQQTILNFKSSPNIEGVDMVFVILMGHGNQNPNLNATEIIGIDNESVTTEWVEEQFDNVHCKVLHKIPKIIMYQSCRGRMVDYGVAFRTEKDSAGNVTLRTRSDMLVAYATLPGTVSHRDIYLGTWYMNLFCEIMMNRAHATHIENIFKILDAKLASLQSPNKSMQTSMFTNIGFKTCFIHPGIYMEDGQIKNLCDASSD